VDVSQYKLLDDFRVSGHWWLPEKPEDKVPGTVTVGPDTAIVLELAGSFSSAEFDIHNVLSPGPRSVQLDIILGADADGDVYTLHRLHALRISNTCTFRVSYMLAGKHFSSANDIVFDSAFVQYTNLESWSCFNFTRQSKSESPDCFSIQVPTGLETLFKMDGVGQIKNLSLEAHALSRFTLSAIEIKPSARFSIDLNAAANLRTWFQLTSDLGHFMTLLIGEPSYIKKLRLFATPDTAVDVFYPSTIRRGEDLHPLEMCLDFRDVQKTVPMIARNWFESLALLAPVYDLLFGTLFGRDAFVRTKFVNLTQALESLHRRTVGGTYVSAREFDPVKDVLNAAVPPDVSADLKKKLSDSLEYANEYSLRKRLKELLRGLDPSTIEMLKIQDMAGTTDVIVRTRNYLTHFTESQKTTIADDIVGLHFMNERLTALLFVLILKRLGIGEGAAARGALKRRFFD
jgi:hypothetical protein